MQNLFVIALIISAIFIVIKVVENNTLDAPKRPLKAIVRDGAVVFICSCIGIFFYDQITQLTSNSIVNDTSKVFTNTPDF